MKLLGMKPICPAFAGFVPLALKRLYPDVKIIETTWAGFHN
ncbi:MAG: alpha-N-acetylglucosaminidase TIM-barrel domain-containing protein [Odoribacter splanchnicus]